MKKNIWQSTSPPNGAYKKILFEKLAKTSDFIYQIGELKALREPAREVPIHKITSDVMQEKFLYLKNCMRGYRKLTGKGRGIAGVQVGIPERFCVLYLPEEKENLLILVNPKITKRSKKLYRYPEVCMSANNLIAPVVRPGWVEVEYFAEKGQKCFWKEKHTTKKGRILNRVIQHEIDHLDGIVNIDKVPSDSLEFVSNPSFYKTASFTLISE